MSIQADSTVRLGDFGAATFDEAARHSGGPRKVPRSPTRAARHALWRERKTSLSSRRVRRLLRKGSS